MNHTKSIHSFLQVSEAQLESAYRWLCQQRKHYPDNADIWSFRFNWNKTKCHLQKVINQGEYQFSPLKRLYKANGQIIHLWCSQDALVMYVVPARNTGHSRVQK